MIWQNNITHLLWNCRASIFNPECLPDFNSMALLKLMGKEKELEEARLLSQTIAIHELEKKGTACRFAFSGKFRWFIHL